nr:beta-d-glucosyl crocetin beta-1,6-glucosyltransferase [Quercus suber]
MLPWLAHGHISPFLELAKKLTTRNIHIYFCTTPINLGPIKQQLSKKYSLSIEFVELHLPSLPELPPHYHTTNGLPPHLMPALKKAMDMASPNITSILKQLKPDLVIYDFLQILTPSLAQSQNIPAVEFVVMSATMTSFFMHLANNPGVEYPSPEIYLQDYEVGKFTDDSDDGDRILECFHQSSEIVLVKTFREIEAKYIDYLSVLAKKKIVPVGPLVQDPVEEDEKKEIIEWLNDKEPSSAVFVSFGSEFFFCQRRKCKR